VSTFAGSKSANYQQQLDGELAADGHDVDRVLHEAEAVPGFADRPRWEAFRKAREALSRQSLIRSTNGRHAARSWPLRIGEIAWHEDIFCWDRLPHAVVKTMLEQVADHVTAFIFRAG